MRKLALLILILPFISFEAEAATVPLGTIKCDFELGGNGPCQTGTRIEQLGLTTIKSTLGCNPSTGSCSAVNGTTYLVKVDVYDKQTCKVFHYFVTGDAFNAPVGNGFYLLLTNERSWFLETCDHPHKCKNEGIPK